MTRTELPPRLRRTLELVYSVDGVAGARVWQWDGRVAVGIRAADANATPALLKRVEDATRSLREPGESWDFGVLDEEP
jgi:hypothetical protein